MEELVKVVVFVPLSHSDQVRHAIGKADGGHLGKYSFSSFSSQGIGRFKPEKGARPAIGKVGKLEEVEEERIEVTCKKDQIKSIVTAIKKIHPYEEVAIDIYPLLDIW